MKIENLIWIYRYSPFLCCFPNIFSVSYLHFIIKCLKEVSNYRSCIAWHHSMGWNMFWFICLQFMVRRPLLESVVDVKHCWRSWKMEQRWEEKGSFIKCILVWWLISFWFYNKPGYFHISNCCIYNHNVVSDVHSSCLPAQLMWINNGTDREAWLLDQIKWF